MADGLGGLPLEPGGKTELESARTPNLDACAREGVCGLSIPVLPGITPGSGPGHLGLFGYDPLEYRIGRGILEALGINFAGRPARRGGPRQLLHASTRQASSPTAAPAGPRPSAASPCARSCKQIKVPGVEVFVEPVREHRFVVVFRGDDLGDAVNDTDPQQVGAAPLTAKGADAASQKTADAVNRFVAEAGQRAQGRCADQHGDAARLRALSEDRHDAGSLRPASRRPSRSIRCTRAWPGWSAWTCSTPARRWATRSRRCERLWNEYDFFFLHYKYTDSTGEDGNFAAKVEMIERLDAEIPQVRALNPDVLIVTGDHSTPSKLKSHSWHPVPMVLWAKTCRPDAVTEFGESQCLRGGLGQFQAMYLMPLAMAHAGRLGKYGA